MLDPMSVKLAGVALFGIGFAITELALIFVVPGKSKLRTFMRGSFQRREDYTDAGWRLIVIGRVMGFAGFGLVVFSIYRLGA